MTIYLGFDIGSISIKAALLLPKGAQHGDLKSFKSTDLKHDTGQLLVSDYLRIKGDPAEIISSILEEVKGAFGDDEVVVSTTGNGSKLVTQVTKSSVLNEFMAIAETVRTFYPKVETILEMGGETSKYILIKDGNIIDFSINGDCAAGTGSFIDQQAKRLGYETEELGGIIASAEKSAKIAGRCSVFAKSDMIHAQQKGYTPPEVLSGLSNAVSRNFKATIVRGKKIKPPVAIIGGLAKNEGVVKSLSKILGIDENDIFIPSNGDFWGAIGSVIYTSKESVKQVDIEKMASWPVADRLSTKNVNFLKNLEKPTKLSDKKKTAVYLGIDVGSVSTNLVLINDAGEVVDEIYTRTRARPIEVVSDCLLDIESRLGDKIVVLGVGTTGSGRELIGQLVGADAIRDEITAHKTGAVSVAKQYLNDDVDTIFEIGGQDAKYIYIKGGVVTNFAMNEACAAGTGSFLEEQADRMGVAIKDEFAKRAFVSKRPVKLGERCTVFIEKDINSFQLQGAGTDDLLAGLAYSIVTNYLNRVVGKRPIGKKIFFQGGTAYNDAVAAAFSQILNQKITVPPHNGVIGAVGSALLVRDLVLETGIKTSFKGFDLSKVSYSMREFACNGCTNSCDIQEFNVDNTKTYWGDKCSEKFRSKTKAVEGAVIGNLFKKRDEILKGVINEYPKTENSLNKTLIGIPESMYYWDQAPFWHALLSTLGFTVVTSGETNKKVIKSGLESTVSEPCYPIKVAHGHVQELIDRGVDYIWLPNILSSHSMDGDPKSKIYYVCPWGMTLPFVVRSSNLFADYKDKFLTPTMPYHYGEKAVFNDLLPFAKKFNISKRDLKGALKNAYKAEKSFNLELAKTGEKVLKKVLSENLPAVVILGRPYNTIDKSLNLNLAHKLEKNYGINVIPMDFIPTEGHAETLADNMFWNYGRRILAATKFVNNHDNLDIIYITNFKCGPDSYIKHYAHRGSRKPFLILQFDEHSNDAGFVTRIEAYLDSKGLLKKGISKQSDIKKVEESEKDLTAVNKKREIISEAIEDNE